MVSLEEGRNGVRMSLEWALGNLLPATVEAFKLNDTFHESDQLRGSTFSLTETLQARPRPDIFAFPRSSFALSTLMIGSSWYNQWCHGRKCGQMTAKNNLYDNANLVEKS
jgi:hypothetical protein